MPGQVRWLTAVVTCVATILMQPNGAWASSGNAGVKVSKTVDSATLEPVLNLTFAVDRTSAIPGDVLTYSGKVSNTSSALGVSGRIGAESHGDVTSTIAYYFDQLEYCLQGCGNGLNPNWTAIAGVQAMQAGYTPVVPADSTTGLVLTATGVPSSGVTYPGSGDGLLGTQVPPTDVAIWKYQAAFTLTPAQAAILSDPKQTAVVRNHVHLEVTPRNTDAAQPWDDTALVGNLFQSASNASAATGVTVTVTPPSGPAVALPLGTVNLGASAGYSTTYKVPVPAAKGAGETDSVYLARLGLLEGSALAATAGATGTGLSGPVSASAPAVSTVEHLPLVTIAKSGPATVDAGTSASYPLLLNNVGGAPAGPLSVVDSVPNGATGTVAGVPATLTPGASASATATFPVPASQPAGPLTDTAQVTWQDGNGNVYGPVSSQFTTQVQNNLFGASLTLAPASAGPNVPGTSQTLTATLLDKSGNPIAKQAVTFQVTGANAQVGSATTDAAGHAVFTYTGANAGNDVAQATVSAPGVTLTSNTATISWGKLLQPIALTPVQGNFFPNPNNSCTFDVTKLSQPVFGQSFPDILFNPPAGAVPHNISNVTGTTRPFTDLTVDVNGNYNGQIVAQGNGLQAGAPGLTNFYAEFTGNFIVNQPGDLTFTILHDDGYILGIGNGATRVNGDLLNSPATTTFQQYGVIAASNGGATGEPGSATAHFPAAGTYPFELDYSECGAGGLFLVLETAQFIAQTDPLSIYVGYADGLRGGAKFPFPWQGSPGVNFVGGCTFDAGALRFDNSGDTDITFDKVTVDLPAPSSAHFDLWGPNPLVVPAHQILILTQTGCFNFDTSDYSGAGCGGNNGVQPLVNVTRNGVTTTYTDTHQILNTRGFDLACQGNESTPWQRIAGNASTINVPLPPAIGLNIMPFNVPGALLGQNQALTVSAMDSAGNPLVNLPVTLQVFGPNARNLNATTLPSGLATFGYVGTVAGTDSTQASASSGGLLSISNLGSITWTAPAGGVPNPQPDPNAPPPPAITTPSPADGTIVTKPVPVTASIAPPAGQTIAGWRVFYQALDPGPIVPIAAGSGAPPATLAIFDPTVLVNDTYGITVEATASGGGIQDLTTTVTVLGNLKIGRYTTTYQDFSVPVNGFQMQVQRTYDSIDKSNGDFGVGWRVNVANFRTAPNRILGAGGWTQYNSSCTFGLCFTAFKNSAPRYVSVTFPDQHTEVFDFTPTGGTNLFWGCTPAFTARASVGTTSALAPLDDTGCSYTGDGNLYGSSGPFNPQRFQLTTLDGRALVLDTQKGLVSEKDRNGNTLTIDSTGVHASNGQSITYTRDASGRITQITGPTQSLTYSYSAAGDLATSTDPNGNATTYTYDANHNLLKAAGGAQPAETFQYDASGRLVSVTDGAGNTTQVQNDVGGQKQTVLDANGKLTTVYSYDDMGDIVRVDQISGGQTLTSTATYDSVGHPLTRTDPLGHTWQAGYDNTGKPTSVQTPLKNGLTVTYDSFGAPTAISDPLGNATRFSYDSRGNPTSAVNALGQTDTYTYDAQGHKTAQTDPLGKTTQYTYDSMGRNTSQTDPLGNKTTYTYDAGGRVTSTQDALGNTTSYTHDSLGNLTSETDSLGHVTNFTYNAQGQESSSSDALGNQTTYRYDATNRLSAVSDPLGRTTTYAYDADGRLQTVTDAAGASTSYTYDGFGRLASEKDALGFVTTYAYDGAGRLAGKTLANGGTYTYAYDSDGHPTTTTDPLGHSTSASYDAGGRLVKNTNAVGSATNFTFDGLGRIVLVTDPLGHTQSNTYDAAGHLATTTDQLGNVTSYGYDANGMRVSTIDALGSKTTYTYDADYHLTAVTDPLNRTSRYAYDAIGHVTQTTLPSGIKVSSTYDALGRQATSTDGLGDSISHSYDAAGQEIAMTDARGNKTSYAYDAVGRQTALTDALGGKIAMAYDAAGHRTSSTNPRGDTFTYAYDPLGNLARQTDPAGGAMSYTYDLGGNLVSRTDPRGITVVHAYDAANKLTQTTFPGGSLAFTYDALGRRVSMTDPTGTTTYAYDAAGRLTTLTAPQGAVGYTYDAAGRRTAMSLPGGRNVSYTYDAAGQLSALQDWLSQQITFSYDSDGRRTAINRPGGLKTGYAYDGAGRLVSVNHDGPGGPLAHFAYTLDANGNRTSVTSPAGTESYSLDALNRLTGVSYANGDSASYSYDAAGNRTGLTFNGTHTGYTYDAGGRLTQVGSTSLSYDQAGNLTQLGGDSYGYDWNNQLVSATVAGSASSYKYSGDGLRVTSQTGSTSAAYLWDRAAGLPTLLDDGSRAYLSSGGLLEQATTTTASFPLTDAVGSVRGLADQSGNLVGSTGYDAFGAVRSSTGATSSFGFAGGQTDPTGLSYLLSRYYDAGLGRFLSADSVQPNGPGSQGTNLYAYVSDNPTTAIDPTGQFAAESGALTLISRPSAPALTALDYAIIGVFLLIIEALTIGIILCAVALPPCAPAQTRTDTQDKTGDTTGDTVDNPRPPTEPQKIEWRDVAKQAIRNCLVMGVLSMGPCQVPANSYVPGQDQSEVTSHDFSAIVLHDQPFYLTYTRELNAQLRCDPYADPPLYSCWYDWPNYQPNACLGSKSNRGGKQCDEYPFLSTTSGGPPASKDGAPPGTSLQPVAKADNARQGTTLGNFYRPRPTGCGIQDNAGNPLKGGFLVIPDLAPKDTMYFCGPFNR